MNIVNILNNVADAYPQVPAIIDTHKGLSRTTTFAELEKSAAKVSTLLRQNGLQKGDAVLIFYPMSAELYITLLALFRLGLIAMFLDPSAGKKHIEYCCSLYQPQALIASDKAHLLRLRSPALRHIPLKFVIGFPLPGAISWKIAKKLEPDSEIVPCQPDTPALITFTSGSTAQPKAALRTHGFLLAQYQVLSQTLQLKAKDIDLATLPIFVFANLAAGLTTLIPNVDLRTPGKTSVKPAIAQILTHKPSRTVASPGFLSVLAEYCQEQGLTLPSLEKIFIGGAPVMPRILSTLQQIAPNAEIEIVYGSTEAEPIAHISYQNIPPADIAATLAGRGLLVGKPVSAIQLKIISSSWGKPITSYTSLEFDAACLPAENPGEIVVSGNHVLPGYLYGHGNDQTKFTVNGTPWHRTGDAGYIDTQGQLWLLGRCLGCIKDVDGTLYPLEVEGILQNYPGIRRSAVVLHQRNRILLVELDKKRAFEVNWKKLEQYAANMHIKTVKVCRHLPVDKRHNAKIDYPTLMKLLEG
ncbi:MAG: AMP-binding protein [Gloeotrichia echinulata IR180]|nr:AMP-binding protein [Gloeotrichia echinulata DEX184]